MISNKSICNDSKIISGLLVHIGDGERAKRPDEADSAEHEERPLVLQAGSREPGAPLHRQHRLPRHGRSFRSRSSQAHSFTVSFALV